MSIAKVILMDYAFENNLGYPGRCWHVRVWESEIALGSDLKSLTINESLISLGTALIVLIGRNRTRLPVRLPPPKSSLASQRMRTLKRPQDRRESVS